MVIKKLSMVLFLFGALIAILGGSFAFVPQTKTLTILLLIILGTFIGIINISREQEYGFLLAGGVFIIASVAINSLLERFLLLDVIANILNNFIIFIAPACIAVSFRVILDFASQSDWSLKKEEKIAVELYHKISDSQKLWDNIVLFAVAIAFVILILQLFFSIEEYQVMIMALDGIIIAIFFIDLVVLYRKAHNFKHFVKTSWLDILAVIPMGMIFRVTKLLRFVRILEKMSKASKASKLTTLSKVSKAGKASSSVSKINRPMKALSANRPIKFLSKSSDRYDKSSRKIKRIKMPKSRSKKS
ncbi:hypothetical protein ACFL96_12050 [Thermoproteota archaeon]